MRAFHLGDVLTVSTGYLLSPRGMAGVYEILNYMTGDDIYTHQIPRAMRECRPDILRQHPTLADVQVPDLDGNNWQWWLDEQVAKYGESLEVQPLCPADHEYRDPIDEAVEMVGEKRVIAVRPG